MKYRIFVSEDKVLMVYSLGDGKVHYDRYSLEQRADRSDKTFKAVCEDILEGGHWAEIVWTKVRSQNVKQPKKNN